ncbi:conserved hypothetical protein [Rippkaea orientalis PCC 8801]|uniref:Uncharacterized protein n=1 Tax=Rippkaea orientalis (strain PCC 8801 / RF-1) TaxID=41431 RepID=B7JXC7_RIPO1|nr:hypothetical protein [Rippkaea orientalis]ACK67115.1 conserved hypothetical protein [Rippkaea orientalis PCC 8801]
MDIDKPEYMGYFLDLSVVVTGFSRFHLQGTGQDSLYFDTVRSIIGGEMFAELLKTFHEQGLDAVLESGKFEPIVRNIIKLWYIATWEKLPPEWQERFGTPLNDSTFIASPYAYTEGLVWPAVGVNPPAAKAPGYESWSYPPSVTLASPKN